MARERGASSPKKGMNKDKAAFDLQNVDYSFALNANIFDEHGSGELNLQNEPSNVYCSGFKDGYKVIGHKFDLNNDRTYFFLTNPDTGCSEIGYISSRYTLDGIEQVEKECGCSLEVILENPLENETQQAICEYITILTDCESEECQTKCLNFSIDFPIYESNIHLKDEVIGRTIYFTDGLNPPRYINLDNLQQYTQDVDACSDEVVPECLDCEEMRIFKLFEKPCLEVDTLENGGNLRAGVYEALIAYSTKDGIEISDYYSLTNPLPIFDPNNVVLDQTDLNYLTNYAIRLKVSDLDTNYEFYTIVVIYRSGLDASVSYYKIGVYPIDNTTVTINTTKSPDDQISLRDILSRRPFYKTARGMASGNGYLYQYGMKAQREINLQPVVSLMGAFVKWSTIQANEDLYENGDNVAKYRGYMRDEVVPCSIKFILDGGYETPNFVFIPRPPLDSEIEELGAGYDEDLNNQSVLEYNPDCTGNDRNKRWQFENTAQIIDRCTVPENPAYGENIYDEDVQNVCYADVVTDTVPGPSEVPVSGGTDLVTYINNNLDEILASTDPLWASIQAILGGVYPGDCTPTFGDNCDTPTLVDEVILALSTDTETSTQGIADISEYGETPIPDTCNIYQVESSTGNVPYEDTTFMSTYMRPWEVVYFRNPYTNTACLNATGILQLPVPSGSFTGTNKAHLSYDGALSSIAPLQTTINVSQVSLPDGYTNKLHTNARWYKVDFNGLTSLAIRISGSLVGTTDDICQDTARVSFFEDCSSTTDLASYSTILSDMTLTPDSDKFILINSSDFPSGTAYLAIDSPIKTDVEFEIQLTGTSGELEIDIDGNVYTATFNTDLNTTASDFVTNNSTPTLLNGVSYDILNGSDNIEVSSSGDVLTFRSTEAEYDSITITTTVADLSGTLSEIERYNTLDPFCGCANVFFSQAITTSLIQFTNLTFIKKQTWEATCSFSVPTLGQCDPIPYQYGLFSYWESTETYTCNKDLFDSSGICIEDDQLSFLSPEEKQEFIDYYVEQTVPGIPDTDIDGCYIWKEDPPGNPLVNFRDRPIRHYKFPCSTKVPFMSYNDTTQSVFQAPGAFKDSLIYPIGFSITNEVINTFLDIAVANELITLEERLKIKKYEIHTGDRSVNKSIIAKGLLFDMYEYRDNCPSDELSPGCDTAYYPNYPLNSLGRDYLNGNIPHRFSSQSNNLFTFHSPDIHFYKPFLPNEMKIEGYLFGYSNTIFDEVRDHPKWVILGGESYSLAVFLAWAEVALEIIIYSGPILVNALTGSLGTPGAIALAAIAVAGYTLNSIWTAGKLAYEWVQIFENFGNLNQFAYFSATVGHYNYFVPNSLSENILRGLPTIKYLPPGRLRIPDETAGSQDIFRVNNLDRSDSVFLNLGQYNLNYPQDYINWDNYDLNAFSTSRIPVAYGKGQFSPLEDSLSQGKAASPYVSIKQYLPAQYGSIYSIDWVETGFCGDLSETYDCNPIFGGDVYISRFAVKRKFPFFTSNAHQLADRTPFEYSAYFNINPFQDNNRTYVDYKISDADDQSTFFAFLWPSYKYPYSLTNNNQLLFTNDNPIQSFYIKPPYKFHLFSYGFPHFLVESTINSNYRYAKRQDFQDFYPNNQDVIEMTQESNVSIRERNKYYYNFVYSSLQSQYPYRLLPSTYEKELYEKINDLDNTVIYSRQDGSETDLNDNWLLYKGLDTYTFPKTFGQLVDMDSIESEVILARFENGFTLFGSIDQIRDRVTPQTSNIGQGGIFAGRTVNFNKTDLGYAGTQNTTKVSCNFGHFWPDMKRGQIFQLQPSGKGLNEITSGLSKWFKENLPFKILSGVSGLTQRDLDNNFKGLGVTMGWDSRSSRVFLTKLDYKVKVDNIEYLNNNFYIRQGEELVQISLQDEQYFEDCSFTIAYSPLTEMWISYYSFKPNYYITYDNYFQTGVNYSVDASEEGLWSHLPFLSSYQVFYGKLYPFIIESSLPSKASNSILESVNYWMDVRKYYSKYDYTDVYGQGFNKAFIYNNYQNSGQLNLIHQNNNDLSQAINYPKHNLDSIDILQSETNGKWSFNYFYNIIKNEKAGLPIWKNDCNQIDKTLDNRLLDYTNRFKDRLRGDYFLVRLQQDEESRFKMIYRFQTDIRDFYE
jgi:hypothetical protein